MAVTMNVIMCGAEDAVSALAAEMQLQDHRFVAVYRGPCGRNLDLVDYVLYAEIEVDPRLEFAQRTP